MEGVWDDTLMECLLGRLIAQTAHSVASQEGRAPFLSSIISPPCSILHLSGRKENLGAQRRVDSFLFSKLRRGSWECVRFDLGLGLGLVLCSCSTLVTSLPELSVDPVG